MGQPLLDILAPLTSEKILDLGCGHGTLTEKLLPLCKEVIGIDASENMIKHAQTLGIDAYVMNAEALDYDAEFDAIFSNAALHWMLNPTAVLKGCFHALKPGGRMVAEMGGAGNVQHIHSALNEQRLQLGKSVVMPWFFPNEDEYISLATQAGFSVKQITLFERPTPLPTGLRQWLDTFAHHFVSDLTEQQHAQVLDKACDNLKGILSTNDGQWFADYVRLRFVLIKPE